MNITKLNRKRIFYNVFLFNIIMFALFAATMFLTYKYNYIRREEVIKHRLIRSEKKAENLVKKYGGSKKLLSKYISLYERRVPYKIHIIQGGDKSLYSSKPKGSLKEIIKDGQDFSYLDDSLYYIQKIKFKSTRKKNKLTEVYLAVAKKGIGEVKQAAFRKIIFKGLALYVVVAYILSMLILIISRIHYDRFQSRIFGDLLKQTNDGVIITDSSGSVIFVNTAFLDMFQVKYKEILGSNIDQFNSGMHDEEFFQSMWGQLNRVGKWEGDIVNALGDGTKLYTKLRINEIVNSRTKEKYYIGVYENKTDTKMEKVNILKLHLYDSFTGLPNRTYAANYLEKLNSGKIEFVYLNIIPENIKKINEAYGVETGDKLLLQFIEKIKEIFGYKDFIARIDGRKICVVENIINMESLKEKIRNISDLASKPFKLFGNDIYLKINAGVVFSEEDTEDVKTLMDTPCKPAASLLSDNSLNAINEAVDNKKKKRDEMIKQMEKAVSSEEFKFYYQPIMDLDKKTVIGAEALMRWDSEKIGKISPACFIPLAEQFGFIDKITEWTVRELCSRIKEWKKDLKNTVPVSLNISSNYIEKNNIVELLKNEIEKYSLGVEDIMIEITDHTVNKTKTKEAVNRLADEGFKVIIDNFGTGNSRLKYLENMKISMLKIDREFIKDYPYKNDGGIAKVIIDMGKSLNIQVVGEGVETAEQEDFFKTNGCRLVQGYYYSKPVKEEDFKLQLKKCYKK